jgi:histidine triad (HIT) family protein
LAECIFCRIVAGELPSDRVHEDEHVLAFRDIRPQAPVHVLVIPKQHHASLSDAPDDPALLGRLLLAARELARRLGLADGYRVVVNTGPAGGQTVDHLHLHLLGGRSMTWPPG